MSIIYVFQTSPRPEAVVVELCRGDDGAPSANLVYPRSLRIFDPLMPQAGKMEVHSALAAAVFLSGREKLPLRVSGDIDVWEDRWGALKVADISERNLN